MSSRSDSPDSLVTSETVAKSPASSVTTPGSGKIQPWKAIIDEAKYSTPLATFRDRACDGPHQNIRLLRELDAKSR